MIEQIQKHLITRIAELNEADRKFCETRWDKPEVSTIEKAMAREMSNQVTFARQELQSVQRFIDSTVKKPYLIFNPIETPPPAVPKEDELVLESEMVVVTDGVRMATIKHLTYLDGTAIGWGGLDFTPTMWAYLGTLR